MFRLLGWLDKFFERQGDKVGLKVTPRERKPRHGFGYEREQYEAEHERCMGHSRRDFHEEPSTNPRGTLRLHGSSSDMKPDISMGPCPAGDQAEEGFACPLAHPSAKQSRLYFQAQCFVRYDEIQEDGEVKKLVRPFRSKENAVTKCLEVNGDLFEKIATTIGVEWFDIPDVRGVFYLNAYSDPFSYTLNCKTMGEVRDMWSTLTDIDFASLYQQIAANERGYDGV